MFKKKKEKAKEYKKQRMCRASTRKFPLKRKRYNKI